MSARLSRNEMEVDAGRSSAPRVAPAVTRALEGAYRVGPFWVGRELARGGMASVHVATVDPESRRAASTPEPSVFAIKLVLPELIDRAEFVEMFLDEARITSLIRHPNVCRVHRFGEADDTLYLTMELLHGVPVGALRRAAASLVASSDPGWHRVAVRIAIDACAGLHAAHELTDGDGRPLHVVHRDVSPQNLFVTRDGVTKVLDFGIARSERRLHETSVGTVKGKFSYIAPEQILGGPTDRRADVWSIGVVLWELLAGRALFKRPEELDTIGAVLRPRVPLLPEVPDVLNDVIQAALRADPAQRTASAAELAEPLARWLRGTGGASEEDVALTVERLLPEHPPDDTARPERAREATVKLGARARAAASPPPAPPSAPRPARARPGPLLLALLAALFVWSLGRAWQSRSADDSLARSPTSNHEVP